MLCILSDENQLDAMPVVKTAYYPWARDGYRPLAYGRLAYIEKRGILVDLQSFERDPAVSESADFFSGSCVAVAMAAKGGPLLVVALDARSRYAAFLDGRSLELALEVNTYSGIDEQGWYWGVRFWLPPEQMAHLLGLRSLAPGQTLKGTVYVLHGAAEGDSNMGAAAPATVPSIFSPDNLAEISVIAY